PRGQAPDLAAADVVDAEHALAAVDRDGALLDEAGVGEGGQGHAEDLGDLRLVGRRLVGEGDGADTGDDAEARRRLDLVELAQAQHLRGIDPHLLLRLAEGRPPGVLANLAAAAGEGDLAAVAREVVGALGEHRPELARVDVERYEDCRRPEVARREAPGRRRGEALP